MKRSYLFVLLSGLIGFGVAYWLASLEFIDELEWAAEDARYRLVQRVPEGAAKWSGLGGDCQVIIVAVDERTIAALNGEVLAEKDAAISARAVGEPVPEGEWDRARPYGGMQWPYSPSSYAQVARTLKSWGAHVIGFDAPLHVRWPTDLYGTAFASREYEILHDVADDSCELVIGAALEPAFNDPEAVPVPVTFRAQRPSDRLVRGPYVRVGIAQVFPDPDEVVRHYPLVYPATAEAESSAQRLPNLASVDTGGGRLPSFALALALAADAVARRTAVTSADGVATPGGSRVGEGNLTSRGWATGSGTSPTPDAGDTGDGNGTADDGGNSDAAVPGHAVPALATEVVPLAYYGPPGTFPVVSYIDVLNGRIPALVLERLGCAGTSTDGSNPARDLFKGRIVIVAPTARVIAQAYKSPFGAADVGTPYDEPPAATGEDDGPDSDDETGRAAAALSPLARTGWTPTNQAEIEATAVQMLSTQREQVTYERASPTMNLQLLIAVCLLLVLAVALLPPALSIISFLVMGALLIFGTTWWYDNQGMMFAMVPPLIGGLITFAFGSFANIVVERRSKRGLKELFGKYVSQRVVDSVVKNPKLAALGGEKRELTLMFADLAAFTTWAEPFSPDKLLPLLNEYFSEMSDEIHEQQGTVDKFIGDAVMAFWNAPQRQRDHALRACHAAIGMRRRIKKLNESWRRQGLKPLFFRIGIHTGEVIVGNAGSKDRFEYTAIGDAVNLASRLEATGKFYGVATIISQQTREAAGDDFATRLIDKVRVKGRSEPVAIYELVGLTKDVKTDPSLTEFLNTFHSGLRHYLQRDFEMAIVAFEQSQALMPDDGPCRVFRARCRRFQAQPPPDNWDGSIELTRKD